MCSIEPNLADITIGEEISSVDTIVDGYKTYQVVRAALELGLFDWLDEHGTTPREDLGAALSINGMFTRSFFQTLVDLGFLSGKDDHFSNTGKATRLLLQGSLAYQGDWILNTSGNAGPWNTLKETLTATAPKNTGFSAGPDSRFLRALGERSLRGEIQGVTKIIEAWEGFRSATKLLDIGGRSWALRDRCLPSRTTGCMRWCSINRMLLN